MKDSTKFCLQFIEKSPFSLTESESLLLLYSSTIDWSDFLTLKLSKIILIKMLLKKVK